MKTTTSFAFVALLCFVDVTSSRKLPQIKVLGIQHCCSSEDYLKGLVLYVTHHNRTHNDVHLYVEIVEDIPPNVMLHFEVYATDDTFQDGELVMKNSIPICEESPMRELLPRAVYVNKELLGTGKTCYPKGVIKYDDAGQLRIDVMMPDIVKKGKFFRIDQTFKAGPIDISTIIYYTQAYKE